MDEARIIAELDACLATEEELTTQRWKKGFDDEWPLHRLYPIQE